MQPKNRPTTGQKSNMLSTPELEFRLAIAGIAGLLLLAIIIALLDQGPWAIATCVLGMCMVAGRHLSRCLFDPELPIDDESPRGDTRARGLKLYRGG